MLERIFPAWAVKREQARLTAMAYRKAVQIWESTPEFAQDDDEGEWSQLSGNKEHYSSDDLDTMRQQARSFYYKDPGARGLIDGMVRFVLGRNAGVMSEDEQAQSYWDAWCKARSVRFDGRSKELVRRLFRDGEFFLRFFPTNDEVAFEWGEEGNRQTGKGSIMEIRFIDPEEIKDKTNTHSHGIETDPDDVEKVLAYHRAFFKDNVEVSDVIDAEEIIHGKIMCDGNEKRGVSFLVGVAKYLKSYRSWLDDRIRLNRLRNIFNLVMTPTGAMTPANIKSQFSDEDSTPTGSTASKKIPKPGTILAAKGVGWEFKNLNINATDTKDDGRNIERMICKGTGLVEGVITGDYSNQNYASALIAESPMVRTIEDWQDIVAEFIEQIFQKVIQYGKAEGAVSQDASEECSVNFATMVHRNLQEDTTAYQMHRMNGWASSKTISTKLGYDYEEEREQMAKEDEEEMGKEKQREEPGLT